MMQQLILATRNRNKVRELEALLRGLPVHIISSRELPPMADVEENEPTYAGNAFKKASAAAAVAGKGAIVMADDSGLEVEALGGLPGVRAARFAGPEAEDGANNRLLLEKLGGLPPEKRSALFRCAIVILFPGEGGSRLIEESCPGRIALSPRGKRGFGYDPLFIHEESGLTFAEMDAEAKNRVSHRGKALRQARLLLEQWLSSPNEPSESRGR